MRVRVQTRVTASDGPESKDAVTEFIVRRARLVFQGNALGPELTYYIQFSFANLDMEPDLRVPVRDAFVTWTPGSSLGVRFGQMKVPFSRQRVESSSALQLVDRSPVVTELNLDRDVGIQLFTRRLFGSARLGASVGLFGGEGRNRLGRAAGLLYVARVDVWPFGQYDDLVEGDLARGERWRLALGGSLSYNQNTNRPRSTIGTPYPAGDFDYTHAALDASVKKRGWAVTSELMYRRAEEDLRQIQGANGASAIIASRSGWGAYAQASRMVTRRLEAAVRYSWLVPAEGTDVTFVGQREAGGGLSYYLSGHDLKVQADYFRVTDPASAHSVHQARLQFQLFF
jgi:hypothetical protein